MFNINHLEEDGGIFFGQLSAPYAPVPQSYTGHLQVPGNHYEDKNSLFNIGV